MEKENNIIKLENVRLAFVNIFQKATFNGNDDKYRVNLLINKNDLNSKNKIDNAINKLLADNKIKLPADKICIKDGDFVEYEGFKNCWSINASSSKRILVIDRDKTPLAEEDDKIYSGCYANALISFWYQNNNFGKRINCAIYGLQFVNHGEPFTKAITSEEILNNFDSLENEGISIDDIGKTIV